MITRAQLKTLNDDINSMLDRISKKTANLAEYNKLKLDCENILSSGHTFSSNKELLREVELKKERLDDGKKFIVAEGF